MRTETDRVRDLLGAHDPLPAAPDGTDHDALMRHILTGPRDDAERRRPRRRRPLLVAVGVAASLVVCLAVAAFVVVTRPSGPSYAATPPLLLAVGGDGAPAAAELNRLAGRAQLTPTQPGRYGYSKAIGWAAATTVYLSHTAAPVYSQSGVHPSVGETWVGRRGGRSCDTIGPRLRTDAEPSRADARRAARLRPTDCHRFGPHTFAPTHRELGEHPHRLRHLLRTSGDVTGAARVFEYVGDALGQDPQSPEYTATVLRVLASTPDVRYRGVVHDRLGRRAAAFTTTIEDGRLRTLRVLLVDPDTGMITGEEEIVLVAGEVDMDVPAVTGYTAIVREGYVDRIGSRP